MSVADSSMTDNDDAVLSAEEGWQTVRSTIHDARGAMYAAGSTAILLMWAGIISIAYLAQYAVGALAPDFADRHPWYPGPLWVMLTLPGVIGSMVIGHRAGAKVSPGAAMRGAGIRVFLYWMAVIAAAALLPGAAGLWSDAGSEKIPFVLMGIFALGYVLFGILNRPVIAVFGLGMAVAFYAPHYLFDDAAPAVSGIAMLVMLASVAARVRRSEEW